MWKRLFIHFSILVFIFALPLLVLAAPGDVQIAELENKITELKSQENTLSKQIGILNSQISLTTLRIDNTRAAITKLSKEIDELAGEIERLEILLTKRLKLLLRRIPESYKRKAVPQFGLLFFSQNFPDFLSRAKYIATVQEQDAQLLVQLKATQNHFGERKNLREQKRLQQETLKKQLEAETRELNNQKRDKQILLTQTKNSEATYQQLLAQALAEKQAIQAILAGGGSEVKVGSVNAGDKIASIIEGRSCNSGGTHVHFIVSRNGNPNNPFNFLKGISYENCSGYSCGDSSGDPFNPSGSWEWPIDGPVKFSQGYGSTWAIAHTWVGQIYSFHDGIDISGSSLNVRTVQPGELFRGSYSVKGGCSLKYVKVDHKDSDLDTYYLHVNYF